MPETALSRDELALARRIYARQVLALAGIASNPRLEEALASIPRERFLGPPPWHASRPMGYETLPSQDPVVVYQDVLFALAAQRGVNNGSPSLHARSLHALSLQEGERAVHIGAGTGYYTALIAHLVGERGHVCAVEFDPDLCERARANLADRPNVTVVHGDGAGWPQEDSDAVYVNFSVERPAESWIDRLRSGGRLVFPLGIPGSRRTPQGGVHAIHGAGLLVTRHERGLSAKWLGPAYFVCAEGRLSAPAHERQALKEAFERGGVEFVRSLIWRRPALPDRCWFTGAGWALSYDEVGG